jgi:hypothetical protein
MPFLKSQGVFIRNFFESSIKIRNALKTTIVARFSNVFIQQQKFLSLIDSVMIQEFGKS